MMPSLFRPIRAGWWSLLALVCFTAATPDPAPTPSGRDVLRRAVEPVVDAFSRSPDGPNRAISMRWRLVEATNQPAELRGSTLLFRAQAAPDNRVLFQFPALGTIVTICRQNQSVWVAPASRLAPLLQRVQAAKVSKADQEPIAPLRLAIPTKLLWFLFRFMPVRDAGSEGLGTVPCRQLDLDPPDGSKADKNKYFRLWVRTDLFQLARIDWQTNATDHGTLVVEDARIVPSLPATDFQPDAAQRAESLDIPAGRFRPFMKLLGQEEEKRQKAQKARGRDGCAGGPLKRWVVQSARRRGGSKGNPHGAPVRDLDGGYL